MNTCLLSFFIRNQLFENIFVANEKLLCLIFQCILTRTKQLCWASSENQKVKPNEIVQTCAKSKLIPSGRTPDLLHF